MPVGPSASRRLSLRMCHPASLAVPSGPHFVARAAILTLASMEARACSPRTLAAGWVS